MAIISTARSVLKYAPFLRKFVAHKVIPSGLFDRLILNYGISDKWKQRVKLVCEAPDNEFIDRVPNAGLIQKGKQIMHNGLRINAGSYYGFEEAILMHANRGVHEPQEERVFQAVLQEMAPGSVMVELGAFWSFYSMWFNKNVTNARNFMLEPDEFNLESGKNNFKLNSMCGEFRHCGIGEESGVMPNGVPTVCIDDFVRKEGIDHIHLLHADIQGYELDMLRGAKNLFNSKSVDWVFISTHGEELHSNCLIELRKFDYLIVAGVRPLESYSVDGIIVAKRNRIGGIDRMNLSLRKGANLTEAGDSKL
ncbi:FkbM family methyltransferase [Desulfospira joergensenii]|uniref:FkbM family methyltransferase n=1 Tax=Desulfospira joergensenii TaxID=53329 RepID=UPI0003B4AB07|nr:FkbM family methyltransferase [Desulfospira joergensenii]